MKFELAAECPWCSHCVYLTYDDLAPDPSVIECQCDHEFAVKVEIRAWVRTAKIEWGERSKEQIP